MTTTANFNITTKPNSPVPSSSIFISIVGTNPTGGGNCYLDMKSSSPTFGQLVTLASYVSGTTSQPLSAIAMPIALPAITSARMYISIGSDFSSSNFTVGSGPSMSQINDGGADVLFDFVEFDTSTSGSYNINSTNVDMFATNYSMSLVDNNGHTVTRGLTGTRTQIFNQFINVPSGATSDWYQQLFVAGSSGNILRFLAPAQAAYMDIPATDGYHLAMTNFFKNYVTNHVFKANRTFTFYDKLYPNTENLCTATVDSTGTVMTIVHNETPAETITLNLPTNNMTSADIATNWHNVNGTNSTIDWGFMFLGNDLVTSLPHGWGATDPVYGGPDTAIMALLISICRGVAHLDDGCTAWVNPANYFTPQMTEYYAQIIHANALNNFAYAFAYDDVYGQNSSVFFNTGATVNFSLNSIEPITLSAIEAIPSQTLVSVTQGNDASCVTEYLENQINSNGGVFSMSFCDLPQNLRPTKLEFRFDGIKPTTNISMSYTLGCPTAGTPVVVDVTDKIASNGGVYVMTFALNAPAAQQLNTIQFSLS